MNRWISRTGWKWGQCLFDADKLVITAQGLPHLLTFTALPRQVMDINLFETHICIVNAHHEHVERFLGFQGYLIRFETIHPFYDWDSREAWGVLLGWEMFRWYLVKFRNHNVDFTAHLSIGVLRLTHNGRQHIVNLHSDLLYYYKF